MASIQHGGISGSAQTIQKITGQIIKGASGKKEIVSNTTAGWNAQSSLIGVKDTIYVYTDYKTVDGQLVPNIKIGTGSAYLIDLPFVVSETSVTPEQIEFWNNKCSVMIDPTHPNRIIFYTD